MIILGTDQNLHHFFSSEHWMGDGTFSIVPTGYQQLFTLLGFVHQLWVSLLHVIMRHRKVNDYFKMFEEHLILAMNLDIDIPQHPIILLDFEKASASAFKTTFPDGQVYRRFFYLWNTIIR